MAKAKQALERKKKPVSCSLSKSDAAMFGASSSNKIQRTVITNPPISKIKTFKPLYSVYWF